jgi:hypothetical protein
VARSSPLHEQFDTSEIQEATFLHGLLFVKQSLGVARQFQQSNPLFKIGLVGLLMPRDLPQAAVLLFAPVGGELIEEEAVDFSVQLVDVHGVQAGLNAVVFRLEAGKGLLMLPGLVDVAFPQAVGDQLENLR